MRPGPRPPPLPVLEREPGAHAAVVILRPRSRVAAISAVRSLSQLRLPNGAWALFGAEASIAREVLGHDGLDIPRVLPLATDSAGFPSTQSGLLVQLVSESSESLLAALREIDKLAPLCWKDEEVVGGWGPAHQEPFGFRELARWSPEMAEVVTVPEGPGRGGTWILYLRFESDRWRFLGHPERERVRIMGVEVDGTPATSPSNAHRAVVHPFSRSLLRRGYPYRVGGQEGLVFVAAAADPAVHEATLRAMLTEGDRLLAYAPAISGGVYFVSPRFAAGTPS